MECFFYVNGDQGPAAKHARVVSANGAVGFVSLVVDKDRLLAVHLILGLLVHNGVIFESFAFIRVAEAERHKKNDGKGEAVGVNVGHLSLLCARIDVTAHDLGRHVAHLAEYSKIFLVGGHVVVVANEQVARVGIKEEASVVQILVGVSFLVELLEGQAKLDAPPQKRGLVSAFVFTREVGHKGHVVLRSQVHHVAEAVLGLHESARP